MYGYKAGTASGDFLKFLLPLKPEKLPGNHIGLAGPKMQVLRMQDKISPVVASLFQITFHTVALQTSLGQHKPQVPVPAAHPEGTDITAASPAPDMCIAASVHTNLRIRIKIRKCHIDPQICSQRINIKIRLIFKHIGFQQRPSFRKLRFHLCAQIQP